MTKVKYLKNIHEDEVEAILNKYLQDGWHWWPQTYHVLEHNSGRLYWNFIISCEENTTEVKDHA